MSRTAIVASLTALVTLVSVAGCKTEKVIDPKTQQDLDQCLKDKADQAKLIKAEEDENRRMREKGGGGGEIVVSIDGNALTIRPAAAGEARPLDDKTLGEASREFVSVVEKSRGAIQKCYEQALKKNAGLQARTVTLSVSASFAAGQVKGSNFVPSLGDAFDACIRTVASKWTMPTSSPTMTFKAQVSLTPS
jgi:hypothetical protein